MVFGANLRSALSTLAHAVTRNDKMIIGDYLHRYITKLYPTVGKLFSSPRIMTKNRTKHPPTHQARRVTFIFIFFHCFIYSMLYKLAYSTSIKILSIKFDDIFISISYLYFDFIMVFCVFHYDYKTTYHRINYY